MTITKRQIDEAAFWEEEVICLDCGAVGEEVEACEVCGGESLVPPELAKLVLENVEEEGEEGE